MGARIPASPWLKVLVLEVASGVTVIGYRFVVFLITLYTTGRH